ncbi:hypothetical protein WR25_01429 [Diploscapter pachys]|uniref:Uncharacterized protein n=1 Tax=Diploscapter pachys TaxID=2018661 RepID=A0A2A2JP24_9BILA|nr:hypothetical protein WR25_01429 [Diploscapter pachys]
MSCSEASTESKQLATLTTMSYTSSIQTTPLYHPPPSYQPMTPLVGTTTASSSLPSLQCTTSFESLNASSSSMLSLPSIATLQKPSSENAMQSFNVREENDFFNNTGEAQKVRSASFGGASSYRELYLNNSGPYIARSWPYYHPTLAPISDTYRKLVYFQQFSISEFPNQMSRISANGIGDLSVSTLNLCAIIYCFSNYYHDTFCQIPVRVCSIPAKNLR